MGYADGGATEESAAIDLLERDEQLRRLGEAFAQARAGRGRIIAIAGEAGAGKTALTERFAADHAQLARVYRGACENLTTPEVLLPLRDIARAAGKALSFDLGTNHIRSFEFLLQLLDDGSEPSLLVIEDVHWADTATLDLIRFLGRRDRPDTFSDRDHVPRRGSGCPIARAQSTR